MAFQLVHAIERSDHSDKPRILAILLRKLVSNELALRDYMFAVHLVSEMYWPGLRDFILDRVDSRPGMHEHLIGRNLIYITPQMATAEADEVGGYEVSRFGKTLQEVLSPHVSQHSGSQ